MKLIEHDPSQDNADMMDFREFCFSLTSTAEQLLVAFSLGTGPTFAYSSHYGENARLANQLVVLDGKD